MSAEATKAIACDLYAALNAAFNRGHLDALDAVLAPDVDDHGVLPREAPGLAGYKQAVERFRAAFSEVELRVEDQVAEGDTVAVRYAARGTHTGEFMGFPPTGKPVTVTGIDLLRVAGGKVVERWGQLDLLGLLQQLGPAPAPGPAAGRSR